MGKLIFSLYHNSFSSVPLPPLLMIGSLAFSASCLLNKRHFGNGEVCPSRKGSVIFQSKQTLAFLLSTNSNFSLTCFYFVCFCSFSQKIDTTIGNNISIVFFRFYNISTSNFAFYYVTFFLIYFRFNNWSFNCVPTPTPNMPVVTWLPILTAILKLAFLPYICIFYSNNAVNNTRILKFFFR